MSNTKHNHTARDIKPLGKCPACDEYHDRRIPKPDTKPKAAREWWIDEHMNAYSIDHGLLKGIHVTEKSYADQLEEKLRRVQAQNDRLRVESKLAALKDCQEKLRICTEALEKIVDVNRCDSDLDANDREEIAEKALAAVRGK